MRSWKRAVLALGFSLLTLSSAVNVIAADEIPLTPVPDIETYNELGCTVEPANLDRVREIAGDAIDDPDAILPEEAPIDGGEIVTGKDAEATVELMNQLIACINHLDYPRLLALLSDDLIERAAYDIVGSMPDDIEESMPEPDEFVLIVGASDVYEQPDGRLAYSVAIGDSYNVNSDNIPVPFQLIQIIAVEQQDEWKIDDLRIKELEEDEPDCATAGSGEDGCGEPDPPCGDIDAPGCLPPDEAGYIEEDGFSGWLMPAEASADAGLWFLPEDGASAIPFQPTAAQAIEAEAALPGFIADHPNATPRIIDELNSGLYERQYIGLETADASYLVINAYCDRSLASDPAQSILAVEDGGDCFWYAMYDLTSGEFVDLRVNGEA